MTTASTPQNDAGGAPLVRAVRPHAPAAVVGMTAAAHIGGIVDGKALPWTAVEAVPTALLMRPLPVGSVLYDQSDLDAAVAAERERIAQHFDARDMGKDGKPRGIGFYDPHEPAEIIRALGPNE
jgi:hypothetical protein